jgi:hypothetical protein
MNFMLFKTSNNPHMLLHAVRNAHMAVQKAFDMWANLAVTATEIYLLEFADHKSHGCYHSPPCAPMWLFSASKTQILDILWRQRDKKILDFTCGVEIRIFVNAYINRIVVSDLKKLLSMIQGGI